MLNVLMVFLILAACLVASLFLVGQYNALVTVRHRIATVVLQIDFLLQQQAAEVEVNERMAMEGGEMEEIRSARAASHKAAANPFEQGALDALSNARNTVTRASREIRSMGTRDSRMHQLDQASLKLEGLVAHYRGMLGENLTSWIARRILNA
jgi:hypothetical protein